ncbi:hypothetical protein F4802DRAFT_611456 [Xylaria palmicola]|nr:hypothetical protein F4802DRAFT_611456 [Xylaria palmicola]
MSARDAWEALCKCWINVYQGPPDNIVHDPGTNFASDEFRNHAKIMGVRCREMPVEAHWAIGKIERAHGPLKRTYDILREEIDVRTNNESILQMAVKALNDTAGPNGLVPTLLVFGAYPRINENSPPSPTLVRRAAAIQKAMKMLRENRAKVEINRAIKERNGPTSYDVLTLPLRSEVLVWREKGGWEGPYEIEAIEDSDVIVASVNGPIRFRCTQVKPYYRTKDNRTTNVEEDNIRPVQPTVARKKRGRPRKEPATNLLYEGQTAETFLAQKEQQALELAIKLRTDGIITTPGKPFEESDATEINELVARGVFEFIAYNPAVHDKKHVFKSRLVREVKGKNTKPYEKSRLVVQGYNDTGKSTVLTQSPTIQRMSQRLILALGPTLVQDFGASCELRDITQAYFNGGRISSYEGNITLTQKGQAKDLEEIDPRTEGFAQAYVSQRARGAYISSVCQPEAAYDLAVAAQVTEPQSHDVEALNKRIKWQKDNLTRGLTFIPLDFCCTKLFVFTDGSFANNLDLTSQLGFIIVLATESRTKDPTNLDFEIQGNIVHWNSSKCKRVTRSVLASELYGMVNGFDSAIALRTTLKNIMEALNLPPIPTVLCSDSKSLYDCLVKLGTTQEKRLMIDIMSLRESYEKKEISEVRWINGKDNPADAFTKRAPNQALETLVSTNKLLVRVEALVERL